MDFFEQQDKARGKTGTLIFYFLMAVVCIIVAVFALFSAVFMQVEEYRSFAWTIELALMTSIGTVIVVTLASLGRIVSLSSGGATVANALGGKIISPNTGDPFERRIRNVVEEMAIASGTPVPPVYLMEEEGINAFAAGFSPRDAVIGITRGCATKLTRDQLQGVVAHEFSHILNGDMRINIRLTGILFGIVFLARIGEIMLYSGRGSRYRRRSKDDKGGALMLIGIGLVAIGLIGGFFGSLIRAAVSRQREFLADASAVQFTRNPDGIAGALKRIGGFSSSSKVTAPGAKDFSHMFFGSAMSSMFATHPPLPVRIRRIEPNWKNTYPDTDQITEQVTEFSGLSGVSGFSSGQQAAPSSPQQVPERQPGEKSESARTFLKTATEPGQAEIERARQLLADMPPALLELAREPFGARCVIFSLLLDLENSTVIQKQLSMISEQAEPGTSEETEKIRGTVFSLNSQQKFVLVEEAAPALSQLSPNQFATFQNITETLIGADEKIDLFEWSLRNVIDHDFGRRHSPRGPLHGRASVRSRLPECSVILGALAHYGQDGADPKPAFDKGIRNLDRTCEAKLPPKEECGLMGLDKALARLSKLSPTAKRSLLNACAHTIDHDGKTSEVEIQILRGLAASISCPLGPAVLPDSSAIKVATEQSPS
jgi:Zn-dependent protease with chaperone function